MIHESNNMLITRSYFGFTTKDSDVIIYILNECSRMTIDLLLKTIFDRAFGADIESKDFRVYIRILCTDVYNRDISFRS